VFLNPKVHSAPEVIVAAVGYAVQIYCDFSGYTDIAIGLALLLGFQFPQNFNAPYAARDLQDFWRRWHMTLSRWLRDYLYIPLGGNRGNEAQLARNIMVTMVLGGLWHGANWTFLIWGALHGLGQVAGHVKRLARVRAGLPEERPGQLWLWLGRLGTFSFVCLAWVFFRATSLSNATEVLGRLVTGWSTPTTLITPLLLVAIVVVLASQFVPPRVTERLQLAFSRQGLLLQSGALGVGLYLVTLLGPVGVAPFIYYRF
jgi:D-alanyl-lipoteichoic acid acyltransferase DltB (MBOAT superfamily)